MDDQNNHQQDRRQIDWTTYFHELTLVRSMAMEASREIAALRSRQDAIDMRHKDLAESIKGMASTIDRFRETLDGELRSLSDRLAQSRIDQEKERGKVFFTVLMAAGGAIGSLAILMAQYVLNL